MEIKVSALDYLCIKFGNEWIPVFRLTDSQLTEWHEAARFIEKYRTTIREHNPTNYVLVYTDPTERVTFEMSTENMANLLKFDNTYGTREPNKVTAIKQLRIMTGASLRASKTLVEYMMYTNHLDLGPMSHDDYFSRIKVIAPNGEAVSSGDLIRTQLGK